MQIPGTFQVKMSHQIDGTSFVWSFPIRQEVLNVLNNTADVPSFTLRTALSAIPFVSDLCGVNVQ